MKKKDLIFYAGAAVLMAVSAQGVSADELVSNEAATTEGNQVQAEKAPEVAVAEKSHNTQSLLVIHPLAAAR